MKSFLATLALCAATLLSLPAAEAAPIYWTIAPASWDDGGLLYGTFTSEIVGGDVQVTDFDLTTTDGTRPNGYGIMRKGYHYVPGPQVRAECCVFGPVGSDRTRNFMIRHEVGQAHTDFYLDLFFNFALDEQHLQNGFPDFGVTECDNCGFLRYLGGTGTRVTGSLTPPSAVPLPPAAWLLASALGSAGVLRRRRR